LEKIDVTMDDEFQNGLFWFVVLGQDSRPIHRKKCDLVIEGVDSASEWLAQMSFSQSKSGSPQSCCVGTLASTLSKHTVY
jgi:hypothetical protein